MVTDLQAWWWRPDPLPTLPVRLPQGTPRRVPTVIWSPFVDLPMFNSQPNEWWPQLVPSDEYADFTYDATNDIAPTDAISGLSLRVSPSGPGEVAASRLTLSTPTLISVWLTGGVPGRT